MAVLIAFAETTNDLTDYLKGLTIKIFWIYVILVIVVYVVTTIISNYYYIKKLKANNDGLLKQFKSDKQEKEKQNNDIYKLLADKILLSSILTSKQIEEFEQKKRFVKGDFSNEKDTGSKDN